MPYYDRADQFKKTLDSFCEFYSNRDDFEAIAIEDYKNSTNEKLHNELIGIVDDYEFQAITHGEYSISYNPSTAYNIGSNVASGEYIIITSPECMHGVDILSGLDEIFESFNGYVICSCMSLDVNGNKNKWYQHSVERNAEFHFCSAMSADLYKKIGGMDEDFTAGYCFDDDAFRDRVKLAGIEFYHADDLVVYHQDHKKHNVPSRQKLWDRNRKLWLEKYGSKGCNSGDGKTYGANA